MDIAQIALFVFAWCAVGFFVALVLGKIMREVNQAEAQGPHVSLNITEFNQEVFAFINDAREKGTIADLSGIVIPGGISFDHYADKESGLLKATFSGDAVFGVGFESMPARIALISLAK